MILKQPGATYWTIFDEKHKSSFWISGSDWAQFDAIQHKILDNALIVKKAASLEKLAEITVFPAVPLEKSIAQHNERGDKVDTPPFYAAQFYPMTRKSMGGIAIDTSARVLDRQSRPIRGPYAGEATGEAGINGKRIGGHILGTGHSPAESRLERSWWTFSYGQVRHPTAKIQGEVTDKPVARDRDTRSVAVTRFQHW